MYMGVSGQCLGHEDGQVLESGSELVCKGSGRVEEHRGAGKASGGRVE